MTPLEYLRAEFENVSETLKDTLRHDFGPSDGEAYYQECKGRLARLKRHNDKIKDPNDERIPDQLEALAGIANRVSLIERSHLGEFSWPFAEAIRELAKGLVVEKNLREELSPHIVHMIAEGTGYHIHPERHSDLYTRRRIAIVAFPRQLKHHVMMHAVFGHELGHAAFFTNTAGKACKNEVLPELCRAGPLHSTANLSAWLSSENAPAQVRALFDSDRKYLRPTLLEKWALELMCDLFGLLTFGPAFVAAHRTLLEPSSKSPYEMELKNSTHPPLAIRRAMLVKALAVLEWDQPTIAQEGPFQDAEKAMIAYLTEVTDDGWSDIFERDQLEAALNMLAKVFEGHEELKASPPDGEMTERLVSRLSNRLPPIYEDIAEDGSANHKQVRIDQCLYAGWVYWLGRTKLVDADQTLSFLQTNRLCDQALLQQKAIEISRLEGNPE